MSLPTIPALTLSGITGPSNPTLARLEFTIDPGPGTGTPLDYGPA